MFVDFFLETFNAHKNQEAIVWRDQHFTYGDILKFYDQAIEQLKKENIGSGDIVTLEADFSPNSIGMLLALINHNCILVPLTAGCRQLEEFCDVAEVQFRLHSYENNQYKVTKFDRKPKNKLILQLQQRQHPGIIVFSSGSTGKSKGAFHDFVPLLEKFKIKRKMKRMITFLMFDHWGGLNTMFYILSNAGTMIALEKRDPELVLSAIEKYKAQVLPTTPTFLNLMLVTKSYENRDLSSLELISYGTEPMPESTLALLNKTFPNITLQQTYGLSELGVMRSKSKSNDSLWVKIGGEGFETRVRDGLLEIKAKSGMLGYLNAESPYTEDGWFKTGDMVDQEGEYFRIHGRKSEMINVGGEKTYPSEVESLLLQIPGVVDAVVSGESNPIVGQIVTATVKLNSNETLPEFRTRMRKQMQEMGVKSFKIPQKIILADEALHSDRFKRARSGMVQK